MAIIKINTELNLIPYSLKQKRKNKLIYSMYISIGILAICVLFVCIYFPMIKLSGLKTEAESLKKQTDSYQVIINKGQSIKNEIDELNKLINKVNELGVNKVTVVDKIRGLEAFIPQDIVFSDLNYSSNTISVNGQASNYSSISEFVANLQMSQYYSGSRISNINYDKTSNLYSFSLIIK